MAENFDAHRESLVIETRTVWPEELGELPAELRREVARQLHADPAAASQLQYVRLHAGFCRRITVTRDDLQRLGAAPQ